MYLKRVCIAVLINEWQLNTQLNQALQQQHRADFSLYLAMLSPAAEEMAPFYPPPAVTEPNKPDLYRQLAVRPARDFALQQADLDPMLQQNSALTEAGITEWRLLHLLHPTPTVIKHDAKKIAADVMDNIDLHSRRRLLGEYAMTHEHDVTSLYEILQAVA